MIDVMRAVSASTPIEAPTIIDRADTKSFSPCSAFGFRSGYSLAEVLGYFSAALKRDAGKTAPAFNG